ncbi:thyroid hormone receptor interactor 4 [Treponema primitia ZAS-2]|uniref:Thyroid hormone receptor interactor 4 n=2 Tax=Treponema primitia TaxID=88058 RepID=F5YJV9_TREPZ|nr:thyroid hormone receptor interactor 4 [Treponema primitia ZAS-2]
MFYNLSMKVLSIRQPYATLVCRGIKTVENRTWDTKYRGKLLIHASGKPLAWPELKYMPDVFTKYHLKYYGYDPLPKDAPDSFRGYIQFLNEIVTQYGLGEKLTYKMPVEEAKNAAKKYGFIMPSQCIVGEAELADIIDDSKDEFAEPSCFHWIFDKAVLYEKPIMNVMGKLRLWEYEK